MQKNYLNDLLKAITSILTLALTLSQLVVAFSPDGKLLLFIDKALITPITIISFLSIMFVTLLSYSFPYYRFLIPFFQNDRKYQEFLRLSDPQKNSQEDMSKLTRVNPPLYITKDVIAIFFVPIVIICSFWFIKIGLDYAESTTATSDVIILQAILYFVSVVGSVFILFTYTLQLIQRSASNERMKSRIDRAIKLATDNNGFDNFPKIVFLETEEFQNGYIPTLIVRVKVDKKSYAIVTDYQVEILKGVYEIKPQKNSNSSSA